MDLFAGLGGFHLALNKLGHECVFAAEIDDQLRTVYEKNFPESKGIVHGDIRQCKDRIPPHDILCAGFPCQPFSKSGSQDGFGDETRGTLFHEILEVVKKRQPRYVVLENVGNFERHDGGRTWEVVKEKLDKLGYWVRGTEHVASGGHGLISPHHFGHPHTRERFFVVASLDELPADPFPRGDRKRVTQLADIVQAKTELTKEVRHEVRLSDQQVECIHHWNTLLQAIPKDLDLPYFPIWGDEIHARYPYEETTPHRSTKNDILLSLRRNGDWKKRKKKDVLALLPSYARTPQDEFPKWKVDFIRWNRQWFREIQPYFPDGWVRDLRKLPASLRKLEWNCQGEKRSLWRYVLQFRPSGLRVKRYTSCPALVAMTTTQIPILGPERRFITRVEGLRLQGFPDTHELPKARERAFMALGNAVHVDVARRIVGALLVGGVAGAKKEHARG
ncbi:MAG: DNA (cytosine-5-)-methyltransferase [Gemmatimonadales bacterium]|nr:DNA (cytosine-5-)-methyltransferase [Gemmatimonadales bacterium]